MVKLRKGFWSNAPKKKLSQSARDSVRNSRWKRAQKPIKIEQARPLPFASRVVSQTQARPIHSHIFSWVRNFPIKAIFKHRFFWRMTALLPIVLLCMAVVSWIDKHPVREAVFQSTFMHLDPLMLEPKIQDLLVGSLLEVDLEAIQERLLAVPWVWRVSIRRVWPDRIKIFLTEKKILARWKDDGFVSDQGVIFHAPMTESAQAIWSVLPVLSGKESDASQLLNYYEKMSAVLAPSGLMIGGLSQLDNGWRLQLDNNVSVFLSAEQFMPELIRFRQVYEQLGERRVQVASADLRYHHSVAIRWKDASS